MIQKTLLEIKHSIKTSPINDEQMLMAISSFEILINQIDFSSEIIPLDNYDMLKKLFSSLKNDELNDAELKLLKILKNRIQNEQAKERC